MDRSTRALVFCHACENEWYKDQHGLVCPECASEFVEEIEGDHDPRQPPPVPPHPLHSHNPWANTNYAPDPDDMEIDELPLNPQPPSALQRMPHPLIDDLAGMFGMAGRGFPPLQQGLMGQRGPSGQRVEIFASGPGATSFTWSSSSGPTARGSGAGPADFTDIIGSVLAPFIGGPATGIPTNQNQPHAPPNTFAALIQSLMNPANAQHGDAVFSNEAFDRVMSQLMEQHVSGTAPGPASAEAIHALPKLGVTRDMMGETGTAECSICMDNVAVSDQVTMLPCKHWFHPPCIEAWLNEHDTCPVCRAGITPKHGPPDVPRTARQPPLHNQDPFELARAQSRDNNPFIVGESPTQARRQRRASGNTRNSNAGSEETAGPSITDRVRSFFGGGGAGASGSG